jgi:16S rRNA (cytidine1402-2'-O)-methyltransferase
VDVDALLTEALERLPVAKAAKEVAATTGLDRHDLYNRALDLKA